MLSYLDRNKLVKIPENFQGNELAYLEEEFRKNFSYQGNVSICISFHKFDTEWDDFIEVERDTAINNKDKLKVIVTSQLVTPAHSAMNDDDSNIPLSSTPSGSKELQPRCLLNDSLPVRKRGPPVLDDTSDDESATCSTIILDSKEGINDVEVVVSSKKLKAIKEEDDAIPLPNPFHLPNHYRSDVEAALKLGRLSNVTRQAFIATIASSMLSYKRYPSSEDYINVGQTIITKYPFLKSPVGSPAVCFLSFVKY